jgi:DNA-binding HxlR family transcriptional regulator
MAIIEDAGIRPYDYWNKVMGGKWKPFIIRGIIFKKVVRFNELKHVLGCSEKVLAQQLRELERDGIITRTIYPEVPPRVEYRFTEDGEKLMPIFDLIHEWSMKQLKSMGAEIAPITYLVHPNNSP